MCCGGVCRELEENQARAKFAMLMVCEGCSKCLRRLQRVDLDDIVRFLVSILGEAEKVVEMVFSSCQNQIFVMTKSHHNVSDILQTLKMTKI